MCGIVGYVGQKSVASVLLVGLEKLEYRGYDSAGIALVNGNELTVTKEKGRIAHLERALRLKNLNGTIGIGHTRWATHGEPSQTNAHPLVNTDGTIAVVHNGIIENYLSLKEELIGKGYVFASETDTEVIPHLVDMYLKEVSTVEEAFRKSIARLEGKYAIAMVTEKEPEKIFFVRNGSPLIVAEATNVNGERELFLASDAPAFIPLAKKVYYLKNGEWGYLNHGLHLFDDKDVRIEPDLQDLKIDVGQVLLGEFEHYMLKEIHEQPDIVQKILTERITEDNKIRFDELDLNPEFLAGVGRFIIQASGTSLNAGRIAKLYFENFANVTTDADYSSEFRYRNPVAGGDTVVIGISQSGETADTLAGIYEARSKFLKVLSFVNNVNSTIARESDGIIDLFAGPEIGVASTKAYIAELLNLLLFSIYLAEIRFMMDESEKIEILNQLKKLPDQMRKVLTHTAKIHEIAEKLKEKTSVLFLGRTFNFATALEGALKLKEISYIHAEGYAAGEFKHGPIALISEDVPVIVVAPKGEMRTKMLSNLQEVKARKGQVIAVVSENDAELAGLADEVLEIPETPEFISPLLTILPLQLLSYHTALKRGCDVDKPRNLAKSVTVE